ncbi:MAG: hypothetical protein R3F43_13765 [bacterium]
MDNPFFDDTLQDAATDLAGPVGFLAPALTLELDAGAHRLAAQASGRVTRHTGSADALGGHGALGIAWRSPARPASPWMPAWRPAPTPSTASRRTPGSRVAPTSAPPGRPRLAPGSSCRRAPWPDGTRTARSSPRAPRARSRRTRPWPWARGR